MPAPTSETDICNLMMDLLGQAANISSIETSGNLTEPEKRCARWYDKTRRSLLRAFPWTFARARFQASRDATTPSFGWADAYNLPNDLIRLNFIGDDTILDLKGKYALEGKQILLNNSGAASINMGYTKDENVVTKFDSLFIGLLAVEGAINMSYKFTLKPSIKRDLLQEKKELRIEAKSVNSQERPPRRIERSKFVAARRNLTFNLASPNHDFET